MDHPLALSRLTAMRDARTDSSAFRAALTELTTMLVYEAARLFAVEHYDVTTPVDVAEGTRLAQPAADRAGAAGRSRAWPTPRSRCCPESSMGFVGLARDEHTFEPRAYMESLPTDLTGMPVLVLDPMLATGGSLEHCCRLLADRGCTDITVVCVLAAPPGIERLAASGLPMRLVTASDRPGTERTHVHRSRSRGRR